ncbi:MAG: Complex I intermediate-associated protein 30 (CIA30) [uncultured Thiotrichaceae bacterium]|uniref:Complex I intermediate-associated protein 30 (CIA30) n=1 Tax=uncultured Thiotrichaceae bacterium TaxID=298394 RepID=A0A6S6TJC0_9GAMM|nr:MAG: Complex I intermediate-associated protein 30 (CIA30) [uncultured Thiotrichaceae bacterium]
MSLFIRVLLLLTLITPVTVQAEKSVQQALAKYAWEKRQLIVFSPSTDNPEYQRFNQVANEFADDFTERRMHTWRVVPGQAVTLENKAQTTLRHQQFYEHFRMQAADFKILLVGYDQGVKLRQNNVDIVRLFGEIDQMPMRMDEMEEQAMMKTETTSADGIIDDLSRSDATSTLGGQWQMVSDQVMGGVSAGSMLVTEKAGKRCLQLQGQVSTENNGGFLQLALNLNQGKTFNASAYQGIKMDVWGNEESYNLHLRTSSLWFPWQAYRASFTASPQWKTVTLPFSDFKGYKTSKRLNTSKLKRIGLVAIGKNYQADVCLGAIRFY